MAAPFQNYSGGVLLADIVKRNNLARYVQEAIKERSQFVKSGAVVRNSFLDSKELGNLNCWLLNTTEDRYSNTDCFYRSQRFCVCR